MSRVLVTGATGFIGNCTLRPLLESGFVVHGVSRKPRDGKGPGPDPVQWHNADLLDPVARRDLVEVISPTHLLHLAWCTDHGEYWSSAQNLDWVAASLGLFREFVEAGGERAVVAGTCAEYGWDDGMPLSEQASPLSPVSLYGTAKKALEQILMASAKSGAPSLAWGRIFFPYGPGEDPRRLVSSITRALLEGKPAPTSSGEQQRDFVYVEDAARALVTLLASEVQGAVNIASGQAIPVRTVAETIGRHTRRGELLEIGALPRRIGDPIEISADVSRLKQDVGFRPAIALEEGIARTAAWWSDRLGMHKMNPNPGPLASSPTDAPGSSDNT